MRPGFLTTTDYPAGRKHSDRSQAARRPDSGDFSPRGLRSGRNGGSGDGGVAERAAAGSVATSSESSVITITAEIIAWCLRRWVRAPENLGYSGHLHYAAGSGPVAGNYRNQRDGQHRRRLARLAIPKPLQAVVKKKRQQQYATVAGLEILLIYYPKSDNGTFCGNPDVLRSPQNMIAAGFSWRVQ